MVSVRPGDVIAEKYRVERLLGKGGMGHVFAARHLQIGQLVAIKLLSTPGSEANPTSPVQEEEARARFHREAKAVVRLGSEHIARIYDVGVTDDDAPFIVMEHLEGADLAAVIRKRGKLPIPEAVEYVMHACEGLAEAHALGIVHRDVKPANLFLTQTPTGAPLVKVLDFGISKADALPGAFDMTQTSAMLGSPKYMSPEQMHDPRAVDARTDVWSLGVVLYRLVCGVAPFEGDTVGRLCTMVLHETPDPMRVHSAETPTTLEAVVMRCLEKDRTRRLANVAELAAALVPFAIDPTRATQRAARIAGMLGVPVPPTTLAPLPPPRRDRLSMGPWASSPTGTLTEARRSRHVVAIVAAVTLAAASVAFVVTSRWTFSTRAPAAAAPVEPPPTLTVATPAPEPEPAPVPAETAKIAEASPSVATPAPRRAVHPPATGGRRAPAASSPLPGIPDDRK